MAGGHERSHSEDQLLAVVLKRGLSVPWRRMDDKQLEIGRDPVTLTKNALPVDVAFGGRPESRSGSWASSSHPEFGDFVVGVQSPVPACYRHLRG